MVILESLPAHTVEAGDYIEVNDNYLLVEQIEDNGDIVLLYGYSTVTGDNTVEETNAFTYVNLVTED